MDDRELLERAARAAGVEWSAEEGHGWQQIDGLHSVWNPLTDDGDALRLAVKLRMAVVIEPKYGLVYATFDGWRVGMEREEPIDPPDPYAATRRAIVRAAAELSRRG